MDWRHSASKKSLNALEYVTLRAVTFEDTNDDWRLDSFTLARPLCSRSLVQHSMCDGAVVGFFAAAPKLCGHPRYLYVPRGVFSGGKKESLVCPTPLCALSAAMR